MLKGYVDWEPLKLWRWSFVVDKKRKLIFWFPQLLNSWFIFNRSEIYFSSFLVCKYLLKIPHFQISEVVCLCCIYKTLPPTMHYRLRGSIGFLNVQKKSKSKRLFLTQWTPKTDNLFQRQVLSILTKPYQTLMQKYANTNEENYIRKWK